MKYLPKFYFLSAHENHFNSTLKDFNCSIETLDLEIKYFGFRWWHLLILGRKIKERNIEKFDLIMDLQSKIRNSLILKMIPHKFFISNGALGQTRTGTPKRARILSPLCLPISPRGHVVFLLL